MHNAAQTPVASLKLATTQLRPAADDALTPHYAVLCIPLLCFDFVCDAFMLCRAVSSPVLSVPQLGPAANNNTGVTAGLT
jgi:hypothetical protein